MAQSWSWDVPRTGPAPTLSDPRPQSASGCEHVFDGSVRALRTLERVSRQAQIVVSGAREHNLKDVTVAMPRDALVVITGLSGSGKSSLAFDTIYAEGQRR